MLKRLLLLQILPVSPLCLHSSLLSVSVLFYEANSHLTHKCTVHCLFHIHRTNLPYVITSIGGCVGDFPLCLLCWQPQKSKCCSFSNHFHLSNHQRGPNYTCPLAIYCVSACVLSLLGKEAKWNDFNSASSAELATCVKGSRLEVFHKAGRGKLAEFLIKTVPSVSKSVLLTWVNVRWLWVMYCL